MTDQPRGRAQAASYATEALGLTTEGAPPGRHTPTEDLCREAEGQFERGGARTGGEPASAASVREQRLHPVRGGERERQEPSLEDVDSGGGGVSPPAKSQPFLERPRISSVRGTDDAPASPLSPKATALGVDVAPLSPKATSADEPESSVRDSGVRAAASQCRLVCCRVDALVIAYQIRTGSAFAAELNARQTLANLVGSAPFEVAGVKLALGRSGREHASPFENADLRGMFDPAARGGWVLEIVLRAIFLATHVLWHAIELCHRLARGFGAVLASRQRRFDLAADYTDFPLDPGDIELFVTTRARRETFLEEAKDLDEVGGEICKPRLREHRRSALQVTGITVAAGNPLMARVYDKSTELALPGREAKREIEHALWRRGGWDGHAPVTRVEFQHRGAYLDEIGLRDPDSLAAALDATWQRDVRWLRMVERSVVRVSRAPLDPRWVPVAATQFSHPAEPISRSRKHRGGATTDHVLGVAISRLAASGQLASLDVAITEDGEVLDEHGFARLTEAQAGRWLEQTLHRLFKVVGKDTALVLGTRGDRRAAALRLYTKVKAAVNRFSSTDDDKDGAR